jgi:hypothetical protein
MGRKHHFECVECDAVFKIKYDLDDDYYNVLYCPFCGSEMDDDQRDEYEDDEQ